jgi:hypothetical protein
MGKDAPAPTTNESTADIMQAVTKYLPAYMSAQNKEVLPQSRAQLEASQAVSGPYAQLMNDLYKQFGTQMAQTGTEVERINRTGAAQTDLDILKGSGGDLAREAQKISKELDPEYYATRQLQASKLGELLGSINLNDANPEAERLINQESVRSGNNTNPNATSTVANALSFGGELDKRRNSLSNALNVATGFQQTSQSQFNPVVTALNRPSTNTGESKFGGITQAGDQAYNAGNQLMSNIANTHNNSNNINANRRDTLDRMNEITASL